MENSGKGCEFGKYNGLWYRICYGLTQEGKMDYSKELYEFHKDCNCGNCKRRFKNNRGTPNHLTVTTDDKDRFHEAYTLITNYKCNSESAKNRLYINLFEGGEIRHD